MKFTEWLLSISCRRLTSAMTTELLVSQTRLSTVGDRAFLFSNRCSMCMKRSPNNHCVRNLVRCLTQLNLFFSQFTITSSQQNQQVTASCLLGLSVAFDTVDRFILHHLSSWFGLTGTTLSRLESYLSSRSFVIIETTSSAHFSLHQGYPAGSVLGPLPFILYTTPLSTLI